jgi:hypothetical protein
MTTNPYGPKRRVTARSVWRVRGLDEAGNIRYSRMFARQHDAQRIVERVAHYYDTVTLDHSHVEFHPLAMFGDRCPDCGAVRWSGQPMVHRHQPRCAFDSTQRKEQR